MFAKRALSMVMVAGVLLVGVQGAPIGTWFAISSPYLPGDQREASIAYNSQRNEYLVVWWSDRAEGDEVWGQRVSRNGALVGAPIAIAQGFGAELRFPDVAYSEHSDEYLVVWEEIDATYWSIRARRVTSAGWLPGALITVASGIVTDTYCTQPAVAFASTADRYLVIYEYGNRYGWMQYGIAARAFTSDGSPEGAAFDVRPFGGGSVLEGLELAYNRARNEFLVTWSEVVSPSGTFGILGRRVKMAGGAGNLGDIFTIADTSGRDDVCPTVGAIPLPAGTGQYLVAWRYMYSPSDGDIYAQRVAGDGVLMDTPIIVSNPTADQSAPAVDGSESGRAYLVTWRHPSAPPFAFVGIRGRAVSTQGTLLGQEEGVAGVFGAAPAVAAGPVGDFLVAYDDLLLGESERDIYGRLWGTRTYLPLAQRN